MISALLAERTDSGMIGLNLEKKMAKSNKPPKPRKLTPALESSTLAQYGTKVFSLSPKAVIQAAEKDIQTLIYNQQIKTERQRLVADGRETKNVDPVRGTAFLPVHVKGKKTARDIISAALAQLSKGAGKRDAPNTFRLYNDKELLEAALALCDAEAAAA